MSRILRSAAIVGAITALSRTLGFVREVLMACFFGTSLAKSAFDVAFKIPNLFRRLFGEGALSAAFVPVFAETLERKGGEDAEKLAHRMMTMLGVTLAMIVAGGILLCALALRFMSLGEKASAVLPLLMIMLPYLFFICLVALCTGILNAFHRFALPAMTPLVLNVVWILSLLVLSPLFGESPGQRIFGVAWGIVGAGVLQLAVQVPMLRGLGIRPRFTVRWKDPAVRRVLLLMGPAAVGMGVHQMNVVVDGLLALTVGTWAPAALTYAERLIYLPLGVFATALGTVLLPTFSRQAARNEPDNIRRTLGRAMRNIMILMAPASIGLMALAVPIIRLAFVWRGGRFDAESMTVTARALFFYAPGLLVFSLYKILVPAFYATKDTKTPVRVGIAMVLLNLAMNITFILTWPEGYKHAGLAFATVLTSALNCAVLGRILSRKIGDPGWAAFGLTSLKSLGAGLAMGLAIWKLQAVLDVALLSLIASDKLRDLAVVGVCIAAGAALYFGLMAILSRRELSALRRK